MQLTWQVTNNHKTAPSTPGVYMYLQGREILYIGKSINLKARLASHVQSARLDEHEALIVNSSDKIKYTLTDSDFLATLLEAELIRTHLPPYNRILRDNKSYLYITINFADDFPKPRLIRGRDLPAKKSKRLIVFGPFQTRKIVEDILRTIRRLIPFCQQERVGKRACFYHKLGLCNPCPSQIKTNAAKLLYRRQLHQIAKILSGNLSPVISDLEKQLKRASSQQDYELALDLRNRLARFTSTLTHHSYTDGRVTSYANNANAVQELAKILQTQLKLSNFPTLSRIECYDASTWQLNNSVVSLVVATEGQLDKSQYRRFKIKNPRAHSDFAMLKEAVDRRLKNKRWPKPSLIIIDGGRPQLKQIQPVLDKLTDPPILMGLAKRPDRLVLLPNLTLKLSPDSHTLHFLQLLRNESHRFANSYRKLLTNKRST